MSKYLKLLFLALALCVGTAWAGDVEDADAAFRRNDYATALAKYKISALKKDAYAQAQVGNMYNEGLGVVQDYAEAVHWYKLAATQGLAIAQSNLGVKYENGQGVVQDYAEAISWYKLAAAQGLASAQSNLGAMYYNGQGVVQDYTRAHMWFNLAAVKGYSVGVKNRDMIAKQMTQQQIAEAQKLARECQARNFKNCD
jgi:TPR repeat protein